MQTLLIDRLRNIMLVKEVDWQEKKMMGGITFMVDEKMCFGTLKGGLLCRIDPAERTELLRHDGAEIISQRGREMKGYVHVQDMGLETDSMLEFWVSKCLAFNPKAKAKKKK
ncbi:MAG: TfoX/Sxy family protein [Bacteroidota bacterium]